ncbi:MAG: hypothetical protein ACKVOM_09610 [Ferruginibacter sp.]
MAFIKKISTAYSVKELLLQYRQNNNMPLLGELYQRYMDLVYGVSLKYLNNSNGAQDAVIEIFGELVLKLNLKKQRDTLTANTIAFNEYVKNNKIPLFDENDIPQNGIVRLFFFVDKNGRPQNIEVVSSTCNACNAQAIILLKNGPLWLASVLQYKYVTVTF